MVVGKKDNHKKTSPTKGKGSVAKPSKKNSGGGDKTATKGNTVDIIRDYLFAMHQVGIDSVDEKEVLLKTGYAHTDSTGYRKAIKELIKDLGHVVKSKGHLALTNVGVAYLEENGVATDIKPPTMEDHQGQLKNTIINNSKAPERAVLAIWDVLADGATHTVDELLKASGYKRLDSTGYREVMKWLKKLDLIENNKVGYQFVDKVFRYGRRP